MTQRPQIRPGTIARSLVILVTVLALWACDPEGKKQCAWVLMPEPSLQEKADPGMITVCARNLTANKEDCRLQTTIDYAKSVYGRKFRYVDLRVKSPGLPRTIDDIKFCDAGG